VTLEIIDAYNETGTFQIPLGKVDCGNCDFLNYSSFILPMQVQA
jgi:hypothetical protein